MTSKPVDRIKRHSKDVLNVDASIERHKARSCGKKRRYGTKATADAVIDGLREARRIGKKENVSSYKCQHCDHYHFGHTP